MDIVSFETAQLLKEKGFNVQVSNCYHPYAEANKNKLITNQPKVNWNESHFLISAPSLDEVEEWLFKTHHIWIRTKYTVYIKHYCEIIVTEKLNYGEKYDLQRTLPELFDTYQDATENAIKYALTNLLK